MPLLHRPDGGGEGLRLPYRAMLAARPVQSWERTKVIEKEQVTGNSERGETPSAPRLEHRLGNANQ